MTMHLSRHSLIKTSRPKAKLTKTKMEEYTIAWRKHNKSMKQKNIHSMVFSTLQEYIDYRYGKKTKTTWETFIPQYRDTGRDKYPSLNSENQFAPALKKENTKYTGTLIKGIAVMHKSNAVPIIDDQHAVDIAKMRR